MARKTKRANGEGSISFDAARNRFRAEFVDPMGKRVAKRFKTRDEAVEWLTTARADVYKGEYIQRSDVTVGEWMIEYLSTYKQGNVKEKTMADYFHTAKCMDAIADIKLQEITAMQVQKFYNTLTCASRTKIQIHRLLKSAITKAFNLEMVGKNIMLSVDTPKKERHEVTVYTREEIQKVLEFIKTDEYYKIYFPMILTAITTGLRIGELLALRTSSLHQCYLVITENVVEIEGRSVISTPKTAAGHRRVTLDEQTYKVLAALKQTRESGDFLFLTRNNTMYEQNNVRKAWQTIQKRAGVDVRNFHCLRHTHATQLIANGVPITEVSKRLGHSTVSHTLNIYSHAIPDYDTGVATKIEKIFL